MATKIETDGTRKEVHPKNGSWFTKRELRGLLGVPVGAGPKRRLCCAPTTLRGVMIVYLDSGKQAEEGKQALNPTATLMHVSGTHHMICGPVVVGSDLELSCLEVEEGLEGVVRDFRI